MRSIDFSKLKVGDIISVPAGTTMNTGHSELRLPERF